MLPIQQYFNDIKEIIEQMPFEPIEEVIVSLQQGRLNGRSVFIMGNGGSASTASHFVCDLAKRTRVTGWPNFRVMGLADNMAIFSAYANDEGYETVFAEQLNNLLRPNDIVIGISASGNSRNVINGIELANMRGARTIGFTALGGGKLKSLVQQCVLVPTNRIDQAEDIHMMLVHMITDTLAKQAELLNAISTQHFVQTETAESGDGWVQGLFGQDVKVDEPFQAFTKVVADSPDLLSLISQEFASKLDLHNLLSRILNLTVNYVGASSGSIVVLDDQGEVIDGASAYNGKTEEKPAKMFSETVRNGLAGWVVENRKPAIVENTEQDPRWLRRVWETSRSAICIPLMTMERVIGVLTLTRMQTQQFSMEDLSLLTAITLTLSYSFGLSQNTNGDPIVKG